MRTLSLTFLFTALLMNNLAAQQVHDDIYHVCAHTKSQSSITGPESVHPLMQEYDVLFYHLDLNVLSTATTVSGNARMKAAVAAPVLDTIMLDLMSYMTIDSIVVNGVPRSFTHSNDLITIPVPPIIQGGVFDVITYYHGTPPSSGFFTGISTGNNWTYGKTVTWTLSEPFNARHWWPCKQDLLDKADSSWVFLTCDDDEMAGSNGLLTNVVNAGTGKLRYEWKSKYPIDYYLISFAVSDYQDYSIYAHPQGLNDSILIQNFVYDHPNYLVNNQSDIDETADLIEAFSTYMGMYPFHEEKYGHCLAEIGGGMEHQTMTTLYNFGFELVAHELGHMWFGDNVTCATWSDIWINEGFASYTEYLAYQALATQNDAYWWMVQVNNNVMTQANGSVYVPPSQAVPGNEWRIFNGRLSYNKGASIIHMIRFELQNDSLFFQILQDFQTQYGDSVATGDDFKSVVNTVSGRDFTWFFDQWYYGEGFPTHNLVYKQEGNNLVFTVSQSASYPSVTPLFKMLMEYKVQTSLGDTLIRVFQEYPSQTFVVGIQGTVTNMSIDPNEWTLDAPGTVVVGIDNPKSEFAYNIYPNPANDQYITLSLDTKSSNALDYQIFDLSGRLIIDGQAWRGNNQIAISSLEQGTYLVRISDGDAVSSRKLVRL